MKPKVKAVTFITTIICAFLQMETALSSDTPKVLIEYFFQPGCPECEMVDTFIIPQLKEQFNNKYLIKIMPSNTASPPSRSPQSHWQAF